MSALIWGLTASAAEVPSPPPPPIAEISDGSASSTAPEEQAETWVGEARNHLDNLVSHETQLNVLDAKAHEATVVSAELDFGTMVSDQTNTFARSGVTIRQERLTDGELLSLNQAVDEVGTYNLDDPAQRATLCTRIRTGETQSLTLHAWATEGDASHGNSRNRASAGFVLVGAKEGQRTAMVDLEPGESATLIELVQHDRRGRKKRVERNMTVQRGKRVMTLTEGAEMQRICLEY